MIYLDNAAHHWYRDPAMQLRQIRTLSTHASNEGKNVVDCVAETIADLVNAHDATCVRFAKAARNALDWVLTALLRSGDHVITSSVEHEAVRRPLEKLQQKGLEVTAIPCAPDGALSTSNFSGTIRPNTRAIVLVHASNVAGAIQPLAEIGAIAKARNLLFIVDAAQTAGVYPIDVEALGVNVLTFTGHKGLFGPSGTGGLVVCSREVLADLDRVACQERPPEAALPNLRALQALAEGVRCVANRGVPVIRRHEVGLTERLFSGLRRIAGVSVYGPADPARRVGLVCFNIQGIHPREVALRLETDYDVLCRAGTHHSPAAHRTLGTWPDGSVRLSVGWNNTTDEIDYTIEAIESIVSRHLQREKAAQKHDDQVVLKKRAFAKQPRILIIPQILGAELENTEWSAFKSLAEVEQLKLRGEAYLLNGTEWGVDLEHCLEIARSFKGQYDLIIGECTGAFLWHAVFRLAGDSAPFALVPHFNHVSPPNAFAALLSSQLAGPCDILFAGSRSAMTAFARFGFRCDSLYPLGIDLTRFRQWPLNKAAVRTSLGLTEGHDILLYAGRMEQDKNVLELLDVFERVRETPTLKAELVICYHFHSEHYLEQCRRRAAEIGRVRFVPQPNPETLVRYYNAADLSVSAAVSDFETFGRAPVEAMACGTPPVVAEYDGFRETVPPECGILVPTIMNGYRKWPDITAFSKMILEALADKSMLQRMACSGIQHAQRYGREASLREMLDRCCTVTTVAPVTVVQPDQLIVSLDSYPPDIQALWPELRGAAINKILADYLRTGEPPRMPAQADQQRFFEAWFAHY